MYIITLLVIIFISIVIRDKKITKINYMVGFFESKKKKWIFLLQKDSLSKNQMQKKKNERQQRYRHEHFFVVGFYGLVFIVKHACVCKIGKDFGKERTWQYELLRSHISILTGQIYTCVLATFQNYDNLSDKLIKNNK